VLSKKARVNLITELVAKLAVVNWDEQTLILSTYGVAAVTGDNFGPSLTEVLAETPDTVLLELAEHFDLVVPAGSVAPPASVSSGVRVSEPLFVFASHLSQHRAIVNQVATEMHRFGVNLFVAHDSIPNDAAWQDEIEKGLDRADAGLVFCHPGFIESQWCDQEVGWLLGRHVPVLGLRFDAHPYGPAGRLQAPSALNQTPAQIASTTLTRLASQPSLRPQLAASLVSAMERSTRYRTTDDVWVILREFSDLDSNQCAQLLQAVKANDQISGASSPWDDGQRYVDVIRTWLRTQHGASAIKADLEAFDAFLSPDADPPDFDNVWGDPLPASVEPPF
jgi:hypothetical protein